MKSIIVSMVAAASLVAAGSVLAADMPADTKAKCGMCHGLDKKVVGPAFKDIAAKFKGDATGIAASATKGGAFGWKMGNMPPRGGNATDAQIKEAAGWIAGLK